MQISTTLPVPMRSDVHVVPTKSIGGGWAIKWEHISAYSAYFNTQVEAIGYAVSLARQAAASVVIHGTDGRFRTVWSYDTDGIPKMNKESV